jgi:hypothetical protein
MKELSLKLYIFQSIVPASLARGPGHRHSAGFDRVKPPGNGPAAALTRNQRKAKTRIGKAGPAAQQTALGAKRRCTAGARGIATATKAESTGANGLQPPGAQPERTGTWASILV